MGEREEEIQTRHVINNCLFLSLTALPACLLAFAVKRTNERSERREQHIEQRQHNI
jgi:hypothetical protein